MTMTHDVQTKAKLMRSAFRHLQSALQLLDDAPAPGQIGANVDLAIRQLESAIEALAAPEHV
jgi:hypothetical protein